MTDQEMEKLRSMILCTVGIYNRYRVCLDEVRADELRDKLRQIYEALSIVTDNKKQKESEENENEILKSISDI